MRLYKSEFQIKTICNCISKKPKTMLMIEKETGIMRPNICRYVAKLRLQDKIKIDHIGICPISKNAKVQFLTTNLI